MKKLIVICLVLLTQNLRAQTKVELNNLAKLAKVWGFLKYYHPAVASGELDWDLALLTLIPHAALNKKEFDSKLAGWYHSLPIAKVAKVKTQPVGDSILAVFTQRDILRFNLSDNLTAEFIKLYHFHLPDSSRYLTDKYKQFPLDFILNTEREYSENAYPSRELRLLALFRYWNIINYQYPHKQLMAKRWGTVLPKYIPIFLTAKNEFDYREAVQQLATAMQDSHSFYREESYTQNQSLNVCFDLVKLKGRYLVSGIYNAAFASKEGIKKGDEVLKVNGIPVKKYERLRLSGVTGSNRNAKSRDQARQLLRLDTLKTYQLQVRRGNDLLILNTARYTWAQLNMNSDRVKIKRDPNWKMLSKDVWHVRFFAITTEPELKEMLDSIKNAKVVIWDMRGYPVYALLNQTFASLMPQKTLLGTNANANLYFPGTFKLIPDVYQPEQAKYAIYTGNLIVLVNEQTQSLAESVSAQLALRPNTIVMGRQTAGTTGNINYFDLPGGIQTSFTAVGFYGQAGSFVQNKGVKLAVKVKRSRAEIDRNIDLILKKAISKSVTR